MSLSSSNETPKSMGTIFMGPNPLHEASLANVAGNASSLMWDEKTEAEYMARVQAKAAQRAQEIIEKAQTEASLIIEGAKEEGYARGMHQAQIELEEFREAAGSTAAAVLGAIEGQMHSAINSRVAELAELLKVSVEVAIGRELEVSRAQILESLFHEAAAQISAKSHTTVWAHADDAPVVEDIINSAGPDYASRFRVKGNPSLAPGSIMLENDNSLAENTFEHRKKLIANILSQLENYEGEGSQPENLEPLMEPMAEPLNDLFAEEAVAEKAVAEFESPLGQEENLLGEAALSMPSQFVEAKESLVDEDANLASSFSDAAPSFDAEEAMMDNAAQPEPQEEVLPETPEQAPQS